MAKAKRRCRGDPARYRRGVNRNAIDRLLKAAATRLQLAAFARRFHTLVLLAVAVALAVLLAARLLALFPDPWISLARLAAVPSAALLFAFLFSRRTAPDAAARAIDRCAATKDLFLTASLIREGSANYGGVVIRQAEEKAGTLSASRLLPFNWVPGTRNILIAFAVLAAAVQWLPSLDPFKMNEKREETARQEKRLEETRKVTAARKLELEQKGTALAEQVEQALAKLDKTLKEAKPDQKKINARKLNEEAQDFSELWKKATAQLPKNAMENFEKAAQSFGDNEHRKAIKEMVEKLKKGDADALKQAMQKLREDLKKIAQQPDGADKKAQLEKLAKELAKMADKLREQLGDKGLNEALQRALEQMDMAKENGLTKEALDAANESLQLSEEELKQLARNFKDAKNLEDALKNLAAAKQLNDKGKLDGKDAKAASSQGDYEELYKKLMAQAGEGQGDGEGEGQGDGNGKGKSGQNPGIGNGGTVGENPDTKTATIDEKDKNKLGAGKLLMQWKEEGQGEVGAKAGDYQAAVRALKESVTEAIRNEQVPPGYHTAIQKYFDKLPEKAPK